MTDISFEFFPPKTITAAFSLQRAAQTLSMFAPHFGSVTCSHNPTQTLDTLAALDDASPWPFSSTHYLRHSRQQPTSPIFKGSKTRRR